jgi:hypothetical protein
MDSLRACVAIVTVTWTRNGRNAEKISLDDSDGGARGGDRARPTRYADVF